MNYRKNKGSFIKYLICVCMIFIINLGELLSYNMIDMPITEILLYTFFDGTYQKEKMNLVQTITNIMPLWMWVLLFSNHIVDGNDLDNIYMFTRYQSRKAWYKDKIKKILFENVFFTLIHSFLYGIIATGASKSIWSINDIKFLLCITVIVWLYCWIHVFIANCIRMLAVEERVNVYVILLFVIELFGCSLIELAKNKIIGIVNPTFFLTNFYKLQVEEIGAGVIYLLFLAGMVVQIGNLLIKQIDIGIRRKR